MSDFYYNKSFGYKKRRFIKKNKCKKTSVYSLIPVTTSSSKVYRMRIKSEINNIFSSCNYYNSIEDYIIPSINKEKKKTWSDDMTMITKPSSNCKW